ncbi:MAG: AMP-dependent synthetase and ligase [Ilumatobacteraceae bacterium]|nr:AMP-dependent synthetase and ligase [Ilumatobacteraceae bacterium]
MDVHELLEIVAPTLGDRPMVTDSEGSVTAAELLDGATTIGNWLKSRSVESLVMLDVNSRTVPLGLFGASYAGIPFVPVNYRLADDRLRSLVARTAPSAVIVGDGMRDRLGSIAGVELVDRDVFLEQSKHATTASNAPSTRSAAAVHLFTSGTTGEPKSAILHHDNLTSYVLATVELAGGDQAEAALVSVPPYHIAGVTAILTGLFGGRRIVYLEAFDPAHWVTVVARERVTHAMVVPTMLARVLDEAERRAIGLEDLRSLSYGGGPMPLAIIERAMARLPHVAFVNAYGLTETASTISILDPDDHRRAFASSDPHVRRRLTSVGRPLESVELTVRSPSGEVVGPNEQGEVWVRGPQVSGDYVGRDRAADDDGGWFRTRDAGELDDEGFLYLHGRLDDVIVRGGENLSPGEIESVLTGHPCVEACAVVGIPDIEWGERVVAVVVLRGTETSEDDLRQHVRSSLRSTQTPERILFRSELPMSETGKLLRRVIRAELARELAGSAS